MRSLRALVALVLALLWLPVTLHCAIETAGLFSDTAPCCQHQSAEKADNRADRPDAPAHCGHSACTLVEGGDYQAAQNVLKITAPLALVYFSILLPLAPAAVAAPAILAPVENESPSEVVRTWVFVRRTALPARAPSSVA